MQNKEICYGWLVFCKKFLINSWKFVFKKYTLNSHLSEFITQNKNNEGKMKKVGVSVKKRGV